MVYDVGSDVTRNALSVAQSSVAPGRPPPQQQSTRSPEPGARSQSERPPTDHRGEASEGISSRPVAGQQQDSRPSVPSPVYFEAAPLPHEPRGKDNSRLPSNTMASFTFKDYLADLDLTVEDIKAPGSSCSAAVVGGRPGATDD